MKYTNLQTGENKCWRSNSKFCKLTDEPYVSNFCLNIHLILQQRIGKGICQTNKKIKYTYSQETKHTQKGKRSSIKHNHLVTS